MKLWHYKATWEANILIVSDNEPDLDSLEKYAVKEMHDDTPDISEPALIPEGTALAPSLAWLIPYGQPYGGRARAEDILSGEAERKTKASADFAARMAAEDAERAHDGIERNYNEGGWANPLEREVAWVLAQPCPGCGEKMELRNRAGAWVLDCAHADYQRHKGHGVRHEDLRKCISDWRLRWFRQERPFQAYYGEAKP